MSQKADEKITVVIGAIAGFLTTVSFTPQVYVLWHHAPKPAPDVSLAMFSIISLGVLLWTIYGVRLSRLPVIVPNVITFLLAMSVMIYKLMYG